MLKGMKVEDMEFVVLSELFMIQLLTLDSIESDGEARTQRKKEVSYCISKNRIKNKVTSPFAFAATYFMYLLL